MVRSMVSKVTPVAHVLAEELQLLQRVLKSVHDSVPKSILKKLLERGHQVDLALNFRLLRK